MHDGPVRYPCRAGPRRHLPAHPLGRRLPGTRYSRAGFRYELSRTELSNFDAGYERYIESLQEGLSTGD
ncbi:MAG TPA: hypothetical protein PLK81_01445, partial [Kiritimatiellia bacterium]|nr:hypothetical protein [Kiritimatiellia bacterium]